MTDVLADALAAQLVGARPDDRPRTRDALAALPHPIGPFLSARVDRELDGRVDAVAAWAHADLDVEMWREAVREHVEIPAADWRALVRDAAGEVLAFLVAPAAPGAAHATAAAAGASTPVEAIASRLAEFGAYRYLPDIVSRYAARKELDALDRGALRSLIERVDRRVASELTPAEWAHVLGPLFALVGALPERNGTVPGEVLAEVFEAKGLGDVGARFAGRRALSAAEVYDILNAIRDDQAARGDADADVADEPDAELDAEASAAETSDAGTLALALAGAAVSDADAVELDRLDADADEAAAPDTSESAAPEPEPAEDPGESDGDRAAEVEERGEESEEPDASAEEPDEADPEPDAAPHESDAQLPSDAAEGADTEAEAADGGSEAADGGSEAAEDEAETGSEEAEAGDEEAEEADAEPVVLSGEVWIDPEDSELGPSDAAELAADAEEPAAEELPADEPSMGELEVGTLDPIPPDPIPLDPVPLDPVPLDPVPLEDGLAIADEPPARAERPPEAEPDAPSASEAPPEAGADDEPLWMRFARTSPPPLADAFLAPEPEPDGLDLDGFAVDEASEAPAPDAEPLAAGFDLLPDEAESPPSDSPDAAEIPEGVAPEAAGAEADAASADDEEDEPLWRRFAAEPEPEAPPPATLLDTLAEAPRLPGPRHPDKGGADDPVVALELAALGALPEGRRALYVEHLFGGDAGAYADVLGRIAAAPSWDAATQIIGRDVFRRYRVAIYSEPARSFTDAAEARFRRGG